MSRKSWGALGCAAFLGAALAFPVGVIFGGRDAIRQNGGPAAHADNAFVPAHFRNFYSPKIHDDPYVQDQWRKVVEAIEAQCRRTGERCSEAKAARRSLSEKW